MSYEGLADEEVLKRAAAALRKVPGLPLGSLERAIQWAVYRGCAAELDRRAVAYGMARLAELHDPDPE